MANFYRDNEDIGFLLRHINAGEIAAIVEEDFRYAQEFEHAPRDRAEAVQNYEMVLDSVGELSGDLSIRGPKMLTGLVILSTKTGR